jgi:hypothetical protein
VKTHLPYSIFGIGDIKPEGFSRNISMGRSGIALSSGSYLNNMNPAAYHDMDSISFFLDFGLSSVITKYKTNDNIQRGNDINFRNLALGFRVTRNWSSSIGIAPYSSVAYQINATKDVEGTIDQFNVQMNGSGGLNQFYWDNSYVLFKRLSLGMNATFLFGSISSDEKVSYEYFTYDVLYKQTSRLSKVYLDFGFQYFFPIREKFRLTVGGVFGNNHKLNFKQEISIAQSNGLVFEEKVTQEGTFNLPMYFGGGFALEYANKLTISAEYHYQDWSSVSSVSNEFKYINTNKYRFGVEYIPGSMNQYGFLGRISYRAGYYNDGSYIQVNNTSIGDQGLSLGFGIPFLKNKTSINFSYNYGVKGTTKNGMVKETYHALLLSLTLHDWWFIKPKYD